MVVPDVRFDVPDLCDPPQQDRFELMLITWVGLSLSLLCLFLCILTFSLIRSIQSTRTSIHLHLSICLFVATLIFLAGISRTENQVNTLPLPENLSDTSEYSRGMSARILNDSCG